jgi:hypothetical protein
MDALSALHEAVARTRAAGSLRLRSAMLVEEPPSAGLSLEASIDFETGRTLVRQRPAPIWNEVAARIAKWLPWLSGSDDEKLELDEVWETLFTPDRVYSRHGAGDWEVHAGTGRTGERLGGDPVVMFETLGAADAAQWRGAWIRYRAPGRPSRLAWEIGDVSLDDDMRIVQVFSKTVWRDRRRSPRFARFNQADDPWRRIDVFDHGADLDLPAPGQPE